MRPTARFRHRIDCHGARAAQRHRCRSPGLERLDSRRYDAAARRARIVLLAVEGCPAREIARRLGVSSNIVSLWRRRFQSGGPAALMRDAPGRGRKVTVTAGANARLRALLATNPPAGRWTVRAL